MGALPATSPACRFFRFMASNTESLQEAVRRRLPTIVSEDSEHIPSLGASPGEQAYAVIGDVNQ